MSGETITVNETSQTITVNQTTNTVEVSAPSLTVEVATPGPQGPAGSSTLAGLTDTTFTSLVVDQLLAYNGSKWVNRTLIASDVPALPASQITSGTLGVDRIPDLGASKITSGTLAVTVVPTLPASKITTGTFNDAQVAESNVTQHAAAVAAAVGLNDIGDVSATSPIAVNSFLVYDGTWNKTTPANARTSLGLGTAATSDTGDFEPAGTVSTHAAVTSGVHGISSFGSTLVDDADAATARTTLGLGTAATSATADFVAASSVSAFGATLIDDADAATARTTLGLGTAATSATGDFAAAVHTHALGDLSDVDTAGATTGQVLEFDGADWVPATPAAGGGTEYFQHPDATTVRYFDDLISRGINNSTLGYNGEVCDFSGSSWSWSSIYSTGRQEWDADDALGVMWAEEAGAYDRGTAYGPISVLRYAPSDGDKCLFECRVKFQFNASAVNSFLAVGFISWDNGDNQQNSDLGAVYSFCSMAGIKFDASQTYLRSFFKDNHGTAAGVTTADITSVTKANDTWYRMAAVCTYDATNTRWQVDSYLDGTLVDTQYLTTWGPPPTYGICCYNNGSAVANRYYIDWVSCEYTRWTTPTLLHLEDV